MSSPRPNGTQERILRATRELLEEEGAASVRLEDVARRARVSRQAVYLNFGSRAGLLVALVADLDAKALPFAAPHALLQAGAPAVDLLDAFLTSWLAYLPSIRAVADALLAERAHDEAAESAWQDRMRALHGVVRRVVDRLAEDGVLGSSWRRSEAADWLWGLISVQLYEAMRERRWSHARYADRLRLVVHAMLLEDGHAS